MIEVIIVSLVATVIICFLVFAVVYIYDEAFPPEIVAETAPTQTKKKRVPAPWPSSASPYFQPEQTSDQFGVASSTDHPLYHAIASPGAGTATTPGSGCVFVYKKSTGRMVKTIFPPVGSQDLNFGRTVAFEPDGDEGQTKLLITDKNGVQYHTEF
jgi:hypothetical protein